MLLLVHQPRLGCFVATNERRHFVGGKTEHAIYGMFYRIHQPTIINLCF